MKVIKVNDQGADFQSIDLKEVFAELKASVEERYKKDKVEEFESLKIIDDAVDDEVSTFLEVTNNEEYEPKTCKKRCCLLQ